LYNGNTVDYQFSYEFYEPAKTVI